VFEFGTTFSNPYVPDGSAPWLTAFFKKTSADTVDLTLTNQLQSSTEFITGVYFNVTGVPTNILAPLAASGNGASALAGVNFGADSFNVNGGGKYDIQLDFKKSGDRFTQNESLTITFTRDGLSASAFGVPATSSGGSGPFYAAAKVQGIGTNDDSTMIAGRTVAVTDPAPILPWGIVVFGMAHVIRRRQLA
jgi:hypothetical protein